VGITNGNTPNLEMNFASGQCHLVTADKIILVIGSLGFIIWILWHVTLIETKLCQHYLIILLLLRVAAF
jgi:hypothetical protein